MNDKDNITKGYNALLELGVSPLDIYIYNQVLNSENCFGLEDAEILEKTILIRNNLDRDYNCRFTLDEHIERVLNDYDGSYSDEDEEEMLY